MSFMSAETTVNIVYYFCKYRKANNVFWARFDSKLASDIKSLKNW